MFLFENSFVLFGIDLGGGRKKRERGDIFLDKKKGEREEFFLDKKKV